LVSLELEDWKGQIGKALCKVKRGENASLSIFKGISVEYQHRSLLCKQTGVAFIQVVMKLHRHKPKTMTALRTVEWVMIPTINP
jgi:hypothetical protein